MFLWQLSLYCGSLVSPVTSLPGKLKWDVWEWMELLSIQTIVEVSVITRKGFVERQTTWSVTFLMWGRWKWCYSNVSSFSQDKTYLGSWPCVHATFIKWQGLWRNLHNTHSCIDSTCAVWPLNQSCQGLVKMISPGNLSHIPKNDLLMRGSNWMLQVKIQQELKLGKFPLRVQRDISSCYNSTGIANHISSKHILYIFYIYIHKIHI